MGRKFFYILTVLLFSLSISSFGYGIKKPFLFNGGTTSDGIVISTPEIDGFQMTDKGGLTIVEQTKKATMIFSYHIQCVRLVIIQNIWSQKIHQT